MLNLLTCRIKRGIDVNRSARAFLQMVRPELKILARYAVKGTNIDPDTALADLESFTMDQIQHVYLMGETFWPLPFLFGKPDGRVRRFAGAYSKKTKRFEATHVLEGGDSAFGNPAWDNHVESEPEELDNELTRAARGVVDDGITLSLTEYRVMKFCLSNASDAKRPLNGLHVYLARTTGQPRTKVTKFFKDASDKVRREVLETT